MSDVTSQIAGPAGGTQAPAPGAPGTPGAPGSTPAASFTWPSGLGEPVVDLMKAKGWYDNPTEALPKVLESYWNANKALSGGDVIIAPGDWNNQEAVDKYLAKARGGIAKPEDYGTPVVPDGVKLDANLAAFAQKLAHNWGVPKALFQKGIDAWTAFAGEQAKNYETAQAKANDDAITALRTRVGEEAYNTGVANAQSVYKALAAKGQISRETLAALDKSIGSAPLMELLFAIGAGMKVEGAVLNGGGGAPPTDPTQMTQEQAQAAINTLQGDTEFQAKYTNAKHPEHKVAVERMRLLFEARTRKPA